MCHDRSPNDFVFQVDVEAASITDRQEKLGDVVGVECTGLSRKSRWEILLVQRDIISMTTRTDRVPNDSNAIVDDLFARLGKLTVPTGLRCQVDNDRSG